MNGALSEQEGIVIDSDGHKYLTSGRLVDLLTTLPSNTRVIPNAVGNLLLVDEYGHMAVGYIDFVGEGEMEDMMDVEDM